MGSGQEASVLEMELCHLAHRERPGEGGGKEEGSCLRPSKQMRWGDWVATKWWPRLDLCQEQEVGRGCRNQYPDSQSLSHCQVGLPKAPDRGEAGTLYPNLVGSRFWTR